MPISDKYKVIFLHTPKTGGGTIEQILDIQPSKQSLLIPLKPQDGQAMEPQHMTYNQLRNVIPKQKFESYIKFTFVRNPWDRLVSTYHFDTRGFKLFTDFVEYVYRLFQIYNDKTIFEYPNFNTYRCSHLIPQYLFTGPGVTVYRYEKFNQTCLQIMQLFNIHQTIPQVHSTQHRHYSYYYNQRTQELVAKIYSEDIRRFNYTFARR